MAKSNKKNNTEGKYEQICREYVERDELEKLNQRSAERVLEMERKMYERERRAAERVYEMERRMYERERRAEEIRQKQERKIRAALKMGLLVLIAFVIIAALLFLAYAAVFDWWLSIILSMLLSILTAFRAGYFWHEFKQ